MGFENLFSRGAEDEEEEEEEEVGGFENISTGPWRVFVM